MKQQYRWMFAVLMLACLLLAACAQSQPAADSEEEAQPATVEHLDGAEPTRVTLTEDAVQRLAIQTVAVHDTTVNGSERTVIPYAAILYDTQGNTWTYINSEPLTYVRHPITVDEIEGDEAFLSDGPPAGSTVVTDGAAELYGAEVEFQEE
jgi:ABC-type Fe3+-hydroxamate transport system substrate-binding protein